ncbi:kinase-like protein [Mytilinidion resinicola]|uniref:Kinase-like protein n=1 Tax=Mytilinidion resinicola TaxID=574789 RepID=A0A6A6YYZ5_9PEZI|nr:kinase-like protein [Mytilinidion resinicola]KAF2814142.1 kinase-like protein [Mytilinidion resinicola]
MPSLTTLLSIVLALNPFFLTTAFPTNHEAPSSSFLETRQPVALPADPRIGDVLILRHDQILRKRGFDDDNNSSSFEAFAFDPRFYSHTKRAVEESRFDSIVKHAHASLHKILPNQLFKRATPPDWDEEDAFKCGDTKVMLNEAVNPESGASGSVYQGVTKDGVKVALKMSQNKGVIDKEYAIMTTIGKQDHIVQALAKCEYGLNYVIMMELAELGTLQPRIVAQTYVGNEVLVKAVMDQIFDAVAYFNDKGIAHNDLKDGNVMFNAGEVVKVIDFGEATTDKVVSKIDVAGGIRGPEAETGSTLEIDPISNDEWEVAVLMVSMMIGKKPWTSAAAANARAIWETPANPSLRAAACKKEWPDFSDDFCAVLADVLAPQLSRKKLDVFRTKVANPNLKLFDDCNKKTKTSKRDTEAGEMLVVAVDERAEEWVVRAVVY